MHIIINDDAVNITDFVVHSIPSHSFFEPALRRAQRSYASDVNNNLVDSIPRAWLDSAGEMGDVRAEWFLGCLGAEKFPFDPFDEFENAETPEEMIEKRRE